LLALASRWFSFSLNVTILPRVEGILLFVSLLQQLLLHHSSKDISSFPKIPGAETSFSWGVSDKPRTFNLFFHLVVVYTLRKNDSEKPIWKRKQLYALAGQVREE
jgi:hypothetical protein